MSKMGVARAGRGRSVAVDVDPNVQKIFFSKFSNFYREVTPGSPSPRKPHINTRIRSNRNSLSQQPLWGGFGVVGIQLVVSQRIPAEMCSAGLKYWVVAPLITTNLTSTEHAKITPLGLLICNPAKLLKSPSSFSPRLLPRNTDTAAGLVVITTIVTQSPTTCNCNTANGQHRPTSGSTWIAHPGPQPAIRSPQAPPLFQKQRE